MIRHVLISHYQAEEFKRAFTEGCNEIEGSLDLGRSRQPVQLKEFGVIIEGEQFIPWPAIEYVITHPKGCFFWDNEGFVELCGLSESTGRTYRLFPTQGAPAMHLAGFTMHRMDGILPQDGALAMVHALGHPKGDVLDTATGLGYAAIGLAGQARKVVSIERDLAVRELCKQNPWSEELFSLPNIELFLGDSAELVPTFADDSFGSVLHDPPSMSLAGELYGGAFYKELYRVLKFGGRLFHYIGDPKSAFGSSVTKGVIKRLGEAGFVKTELKPRAFGLVAYKEGRFKRGRREW